MEQKNKGDKMSQEFTSTKPAEQVLSEVISPEKKAELVERLTILKSTLDQIEARTTEQVKKESLKPQATQELDRRIKILQMIGYETRENIASISGIQLTEKYHPSLQNMLKNLDKVNAAYAMILEGLIS
jgi:hypothetical protein